MGGITQRFEKYCAIHSKPVPLLSPAPYTDVGNEPCCFVSSNRVAVGQNRRDETVVVRGVDVVFSYDLGL